MHAVIVRLTVPPEKTAQFEAAITANAAASLRDESGCLRFDVVKASDVAHEYVLYEIYRDEDAYLVEHRSAPHYGIWREALPELIVGDLQVTRGPLIDDDDSLADSVDDVVPANGHSLLLRRREIVPFSRGAGVETHPYVGSWNSAHAHLTTGTTTFPPGAGLPLHTHNVDETVFVVLGEASATVGDETSDLTAGDATWASAGVPHRFENRGAGPMRIYWVYGGRNVTRTICETGETFPHLSEADGAVGSLSNG